MIASQIKRRVNFFDLNQSPFKWCRTGQLISQVTEYGLGDEGGLGGLVTFLAHIEAEGEEGDDGGEGDGGHAHSDDDFG